MIVARVLPMLVLSYNSGLNNNNKSFLYEVISENAPFLCLAKVTKV